MTAREDGWRPGWGDALLVATGAVVLAATLAALLRLDAPWLTWMLSGRWVAYTAVAAMTLVVVAVFVSFEEGRANAHEVAVVAMLSAASIALRVAFAALPQVQPSTFIILSAGVVYGPRAGFMVGALTALVSNLFLGQGLWTPFQMFAWGAAGACGGLVGRIRPDIGRWGMAALGGVWGFLFGWITNLSQLFFYQEVTRRVVLVVYSLSVPFDATHAAANVVVALLFADEVLWVLRRYRRRFTFVLLEGPSGPATEGGGRPSAR
jgi:energy-coupling factor transport system substrate-specific component